MSGTRTLFDQVMPRDRQYFGSASGPIYLSRSQYTELSFLVATDLLPTPKTPLIHRWHIIFSPGTWTPEKTSLAVTRTIPVEMQSDGLELDIPRLKTWILDSFPLLDRGAMRPQYVESRTAVAKQFLADVEDDLLLRYLKEGDRKQYIVRYYDKDSAVAAYARNMLRISHSEGHSTDVSESEVKELRDAFYAAYGGPDPMRGPRVIMTPWLEIFVHHPVTGEQQYSLGGLAGPLIEFK